ncbi:MAG: NAD(P)-binding protein, partial [Anaerolineae bacterium]
MKARQTSAPNPHALIIGAGIAGMQAALDIANSGYQVTLVEKLPSIGGHMAQLSETFPTLDCAQCILTPRTVEVGRHPNIHLITYAEVEDIQGEFGHFRVRIRRRAAGVNWDRCTGCGVCIEKCPTRVESDFDMGLGRRKAIYTLSPQAVPNKPVIDKEHCRYFTQGKCRVCEKFCPTGAIAYDQEDALFEMEAGAIILATGYELYDMTRLGEYGAGQVPDVISGLAFERLLSASGPTAGRIRRPSDGREPKEVVFVQCAGSRDPEKAMPYCSTICCMYTAKHAMLYCHRVPDGQAYVFYIDIRTAGRRYEEFLQRVVEEDRVLYLRGKVSKIFRDGDKVIVWGADTL